MLHIIAGVAVCIVALVAGVWGLLLARRMKRMNTPVPRVLGHVLALVQTLVLAVLVLGLAIYGEGRRPADPLHLRVYGPFMLVALMAAYGFRTTDRRHNLQVFAGVSLVIFALALRAVFTGR